MAVTVGFDAIRNVVDIQIDDRDGLEKLVFSLSREEALQLCHVTLRQLNSLEVVDCPKGGMALPGGWQPLQLTRGAIDQP